MKFTEQELQEFESMITLEVAYIGKINQELDKNIEEGILAILDDLNIKGEWYFSESSLSTPSHRIIGFELDKELSYDDKIEFNLAIRYIFSNTLLIVKI
jgi:hypothetical protein